MGVGWRQAGADVECGGEGVVVRVWGNVGGESDVELRGRDGHRLDVPQAVFW